MPNIFKAFSRTKAEPYQLPDIEELVMEEVPGEAEEETLPETEEDFLPIGEEEPPEQAPEPEEETEEETPISYAQVQADLIMADARREAEQILEQARKDAAKETDAVFAQAKESGYQEGYVQGMAQAMTEANQQREQQAAVLEEEVHRFLEKAGALLDNQMDQSVADLRDLALAVAEKVVCVSLKSSADVISRMIQTAIDKRKRKEWVHIYIAECDAKRLTQMPATLSASLTALSDRVRIIPMAEDESGTCIIEMPDEIVDASAATQLGNLRTILSDTANTASGMNLI
ncbi:MAG: F0F1 ATP synthase subunit delta [Ruminiclostridium sp.]|nr:F0F1 ATP synthase subunit delta [Ruminiclostridium sp.]